MAEKTRRREFLQGSLLTAATMGVLAEERATGAKGGPFAEAGPIVDTQVYLSRWPFRRPWAWRFRRICSRCFCFMRR